MVAAHLQLRLVTWGCVVDERENRRSPRIVCRMLLQLRDPAGSLHEAESAVINQHGALILSPAEMAADDVIGLRNPATGRSSSCRVVWCGPGDARAWWKLGIEFLDDASGFWGDEYRGDVGDVSSSDS